MTINNLIPYPFESQILIIYRTLHLNKWKVYNNDDNNEHGVTVEQRQPVPSTVAPSGERGSNIMNVRFKGQQQSNKASDGKLIDSPYKASAN